VQITGILVVVPADKYLTCTSSKLCLRDNEAVGASKNTRSLLYNFIHYVCSSLTRGIDRPSHDAKGSVENLLLVGRLTRDRANSDVPECGLVLDLLGKLPLLVQAIEFVWERHDSLSNQLLDLVLSVVFPVLHVGRA